MQENEWDVYPNDTTDGIGLHVSTLATTNVSWKELSIYPNPTSVNFLNIKINQDIKVEVFSIFGKKLIQTNIKKSDPKLDISTLSKGVYLIKISHKSSSLSTKIIKL